MPCSLFSLLKYIICIISHFLGLGHLNEPDVCMVGVGRIDYNETPKELMPIMDANADQWMTRHELDGKLTFSDPR